MIPERADSIFARLIAQFRFHTEAPLGTAGEIVFRYRFFRLFSSLFNSRRIDKGRDEIPGQIINQIIHLRIYQREEPSNARELLSSRYLFAGIGYPGKGDLQLPCKRSYSSVNFFGLVKRNDRLACGKNDGLFKRPYGLLAAGGKSPYRFNSVTKEFYADRIRIKR